MPRVLDRCRLCGAEWSFDNVIHHNPVCDFWGTTTITNQRYEMSEKHTESLNTAPQLPDRFKDTTDITEWVAEYKVWYNTRFNP